MLQHVAFVNDADILQLEVLQAGIPNMPVATQLEPPEPDESPDNEQYTGHQLFILLPDIGQAAAGGRGGLGAHGMAPPPPLGHIIIKRQLLISLNYPLIIYRYLWIIHG